MQFRNALFLCKKSSHMFKYFCADVLKYFLHIFQNKSGLRGPVVHNRTFPVPLPFLQRSSGPTATPSHPSILLESTLSGSLPFWSSVLLSLFAARHDRLCPGTTGSLLRRRVFDMWVPVQSRILGPRCAVSEQGPRPSCNFSSLLFWDASHGLNDIGPSLVHDTALSCFLLEHLSTISTPTCVECAFGSQRTHQSSAAQLSRA